MSQRKPFYLTLFVSIRILILVSTVSQEASAVPMTESELRDKYGQAGKTFNGKGSCNRKCDGRNMTCYYEFVVEMYDTMSGLCGGCENHTIEDCFSDGCVTANGVKRTMLTINHQMPGPPIDVCQHDRVIVDVTNKIAGQELSIHWHGLHQKETPWSDGVPMVTQCPIFAGNKFRYMFYARQAGTHYYHSHTGLQRMNGVVGSLNVRDLNDPNADYYDYDLPQDSVLLSDWNNQLAEEKTPGTRNQGIVQADSVLINGRGTYTDPDTGESPYAPIAVFYVERGKRHRFRIDNAASLYCLFEFSIKHHQLTVIATDGYPIEPVVVDSVMSAAGERYDVVMDAINDPNIDETIMTVRATDACIDLKLQTFARIIFVDNITDYPTQFTDSRPFENPPAYESLDYPKTTLNNPHKDCTTRDSYCFASLQQKGVESAVGGNLRDVEAKQVQFLFAFYNGTNIPSSYLSFDDYAGVFTVNGIASISSPVPGLTQDDSAVQYCNKDNLPQNCLGEKVCYCPHRIELELCETYEFLLETAGAINGTLNHPVHLHGHGFQVIDMGTKDQLKSRTPFGKATHLPVVKDTIAIPSGGFAVIKFRACNPGHWFFHCHFEVHLHTGMAAIIKVGNDTDMVKPPENFPTCGDYLTPAYDTYDS